MKTCRGHLTPRNPQAVDVDEIVEGLAALVQSLVDDHPDDGRLADALNALQNG